TLFFCAGMILVSLHKTTVTEMRGIGRAMPITLTAWVVASLCVIGLPLTGGFWSKWYLAHGALAAGEPFMMGVILLGSLLGLAYLLPPAIRAFYAPPADSMDALVAGPEAPWPSLLAVIVTATMTVLLFFAVQPVFELLS